MNEKWEFGYTFDDVLIKPVFSTVESRKDVSLRSEIGKPGKLITMEFPIISSNMATITGSTMAEAMARAGGLGILHRFMTVSDNIQEFNRLHFQGLACGVSIGIGHTEGERAAALIKAGAQMICIDVAHGAQKSVVDQYKWLRKGYGDDIYIMVGNFATTDSVKSFIDSIGEYPDAIKVGIGPGSVCTTRVKTGIGIPQLSAIINIANYIKGSDSCVIADGGMRNSGDIAKALAVGAHAVMLGGMLAGTDECPGDISSRNTPEGAVSDIGWKDYKVYEGSANNGYGTGWKTSEGVKIMVPCKGPVSLVLKDIEGGLRSAFTYTNSENIEEFRQNAEFVRVSSSTKYENMAHGEGRKQ